MLLIYRSKFSRAERSGNNLSLEKKHTSSSTQYKRGGEPMLLPLLAYTASRTKNRVEDIWMTSPHPLSMAMTSPTAAKLVQGTAIDQDKSRINPG